MKTNFYAFALGLAGLVLPSLSSSAQAPATRTCASMEALAAHVAADPALAQRMRNIDNQALQYAAQSKGTAQRTMASVTIPVVVHVLYNTAAQNVSDAQIASQIAVLNEDFQKLNADVSKTPSAFAGLAANVNIAFTLAKRDPSGNATTGIQRKSTTITSWDTNDRMKSTATGGLNAWNSGQYLNIWVCNLSGGVLGYAQFPGGGASTDGIVILTSAFGRNGSALAPFNQGRTTTHEVGHWLNLRHIWGDASCGTDGVSDTPTQEAPNAGCPSFPSRSCGNTASGDMFMNYMDYTDDKCMFMFSTGQSTRMNALFATGGARVSLKTSLGGTAPGAPADTTVPTTAITGPSSASESFTAAFTDADNEGVTNRFYQPLEWRTNEWRANRGNGFYNDNFGNAALHPDYVAGLDDWQGTWAETAAGTLRQSNTTATNTGLSTFLSQTAGGNAYVYNFAAKVNSTAGTRRFGLHLMASSNTLRERGNSYLVWFSLDQQTVSIIETIDNALTPRASAALALGSGTFADYKVLYDTSTGTIQVFQNNNLVTSWTDATPLTSGTYISLRTATADVEFDDLKVYKSRGTSATITVGSANTNDVRTSGTPGAKIKSLVKDAAHNWSAPGNLDVDITIAAARLATTTATATATAGATSVYPNPVTATDGQFTVGYSMAAAGEVSIELLDGQGTHLVRLVRRQAAGTHQTTVPTQALAKQGLYFVKLTTPGGKSQLIQVLKN
ncbi:MAG TPA: M43 family zinc metalloprotease [Hymenobacter sp.]|jgi:hypothetical protein